MTVVWLVTRYLHDKNITEIMHATTYYTFMYMETRTL